MHLVPFTAPWGILRSLRRLMNGADAVPLEDVARATSDSLRTRATRRRRQLSVQHSVRIGKLPHFSFHRASRFSAISQATTRKRTRTDSKNGGCFQRGVPHLVLVVFLCGDEEEGLRRRKLGTAGPVVSSRSVRLKDTFARISRYVDPQCRNARPYAECSSHVQHRRL